MDHCHWCQTSKILESGQRMTFQSHSLSEPIRSTTRQKQTPAFNKLGKDGCAGRTPLHERRAYLIRLADLLDGRAYGRLPDQPAPRTDDRRRS